MAAPYNIGRDRYYPAPGDGKDRPSVTSFLGAIAKPALPVWSAKVERALVQGIAEEIHGTTTLEGTPQSFAAKLAIRLKQTKYACNQRLEEAGDIGKQLHARIEWVLKGSAGDAPSLVQEAQWAFDAWEKWREETHLEPLMIEKRVDSATYGYAGTADIVARVDGLVVIGDWKTSKSGPYLEQLLQVCAYRHALREMGHFADEPVGGLIVKLPKTADDKKIKLTVVASEEMDDHFKTFLAVRDLWVAIKKFESDRRYR